MERGDCSMMARSSLERYYRFEPTFIESAAGARNSLPIVGLDEYQDDEEDLPQGESPWLLAKSVSTRKSCSPKSCRSIPVNRRGCSGRLRLSATMSAGIPAERRSSAA
jgi:hypothetical protein